MTNTTPLRTEVFSLGQLALSTRLIDALDQFIRAHYIVANNSSMTNDILQAHHIGELAVFYNDQDKIIGFTRILCQKIEVNKKTKIIFNAITYHDQAYNPNQAAARFALTQTMKYQLSHPQEELVYLAQANTPARYHYLASLNEVIYPRAGQAIPDEAMQTIDHLKMLNEWTSPEHHPCIIQNQLPLLPSELMHDHEEDELRRYFRTINPGYRGGDWLLLYIPVDLITITQKIKALVCQRGTLLAELY